MVEPLQSLRLPDAQDVEIVLLKLPDGRVVARTRAELEAAAETPTHRQEGSR